jgi:hypothetical protein
MTLPQLFPLTLDEAWRPGSRIHAPNGAVTP